MKAIITDIKRFAVHDGDGIRTTVFFKGCPLRCVWCHNPETYSAKPETAYFAHKCVNCGRCTEICESNIIKDGKHLFDKSQCITCGKCESVCPNDAFKIYGKEMTVDEILEIVLQDKNFYDNSGGGVTLSGGECLLYPEFCAELLKKCKEKGINTAVDTCGFVSKQAINSVLPYTDVFLYDLKAFDEEVHIKCTGQSNEMILENLKYIDDCGKKIEIRIPYVPTYNDNQVEKLASFIHNLKNIVKVKILPYHNYAASKYDALNMENTLPEIILPTQEECSKLEALLFS